MSNQAQNLVRNLDMKAPLKPILMAYANYANDQGYVWAGVDTIAFDTGYGITAVKGARKTLITEGWMVSKRRFGTSSIMRLNLDQMTSRQVDRGEARQIHPELEFADNRRSESNSREAAERETKATIEQPRGGQLDSREAAEYSAARRPVSISESSEDPSVDAREHLTNGDTTTERARESSSQEEQPQFTPNAAALISGLDYRSHRRPTTGQVAELALLVDAAVAGGLSWPTITTHCRAVLIQARTNPVAYLRGGLHPDNLPTPTQRSSTTHTGKPPWCGQCDEQTRQVEYDHGRVGRCPRCHPHRKTAGHSPKRAFDENNQ